MSLSEVGFNRLVDMRLRWLIGQSRTTQHFACFRPNLDIRGTHNVKVLGDVCVAYPVSQYYESNARSCQDDFELFIWVLLIIPTASLILLVKLDYLAAY
jgi:hypothetical protein